MDTAVEVRYTHLNTPTTLDGRVRLTAVITGASSGIGRATALRLAREGYHVIATSRELDRLDGLLERARDESLSMSAYQLDVNRSESVEAVVPNLLDDAGRVDALVNNAGYALWGSLEDVTIEEVKAQFETNVFAVLRLSQAFLPHMRERTNGTIVNVGSVAGRIGTPAGGAYAASKFALRGLTNVMRMELAPFGVRVVLIEPGLFRTQFLQNRIIARRALDPRSPYSLHTQRIARSSGSHERWSGDPDRVARTITKVIKARKPSRVTPSGPTPSWAASPPGYCPTPFSTTSSPGPRTARFHRGLVLSLAAPAPPVDGPTPAYTHQVGGPRRWVFLHIGPHDTVTRLYPTVRPDTEDVDKVPFLAKFPVMAVLQPRSR